MLVWNAHLAHQPLVHAHGLGLNVGLAARRTHHQPLAQLEPDDDLADILLGPNGKKLSIDDLDSLPELGESAEGRSGCAAVDGAFATAPIISTNGQPLTDRFSVALRAISGEFTPPEEMDNERASGLVDSLLQWPTDFPVKVVSRACAAEEQDALREGVLRVCDEACLEAADLVCVSRLGGKAVSVSLTVLGVPCSKSLEELRRKLRALDHAAMVF